MVAIVAVRAFGIGRGVLRYLERLTGHDAALRVLGELRVRAYRRLDGSPRPGSARRRRGDLAARLVADVDAVRRRAHPGGAAVRGRAAVAGVASVALVGCLLPAGRARPGRGPAGRWPSACPLLQPPRSAAPSRRGSPRCAASWPPASSTWCTGCPTWSRTAPPTARLGRAGRHRPAAARRRRAAPRPPPALGAAAGRARAPGPASGRPRRRAPAAVRAGALAGVLLAVVVLTPLAVFEAVGGTARRRASACAAARAGPGPRRRRSSHAPTRSPDPRRARGRCRAGPPTGRVWRRVARGWAAAGGPCAGRRPRRCARAAGSRSSARAAPARARSPRCWCASSTRAPAGSPSTASTCATCAATTCARVVGYLARGRAPVRHHDRGEPAHRPARRHRRRAARRAGRRPGCWTGSRTLPDGLRHPVGEHGDRAVRRAAAAARAGPRAAGRLPGARPRRADRAPGRADRAALIRRPARRHRRPDRRC